MECIKKLKKASGLERVFLAQLLGEVVETFDKSVHSFAYSSSYENKDELKAERYYAILKLYVNLAVTAMDKEVIAEDKALVKQAMNLINYLPRQLEQIKRYVDQQIAKKKLPEGVDWGDEKKAKPLMGELYPNNAPEIRKLMNTSLSDFFNPSSNFSVQMAALGSNATAPKRMAPESYDDTFTMVHQSLLTVIASVQKRDGIQLEQLPEKVEKLCRRIEKELDLKSHRGRDPTLQSIMYDHPQLIVTYNAPLNFHSAQFAIEATLDTRGNVSSLIFDGHFFADEGLSGTRSENLFYHAIYSYACTALKAPEGFTLKEKFNDVHVRWKVPVGSLDESSFFEKAKSNLQLMINYLQNPWFEDVIKYDMSDFAAMIRYDIKAMRMLNDMENVGNISKLIQVVLEKILSAFTPYNIKNLTYIPMNSELLKELQSEASNLIKSFVNKAFEEDFIWKEPELCFRVLNFIDKFALPWKEQYIPLLLKKIEQIHEDSALWSQWTQHRLLYNTIKEITQQHGTEQQQQQCNLLLSEEKS